MWITEGRGGVQAGGLWVATRFRQQLVIRETRSVQSVTSRRSRSGRKG